MTLVMSVLAVRDLRNAEPALLTFNVDSTRAGQLKVLYEKDGVLVDPGWLIPLREGVTQRAEFPLERGFYKLLGFKPLSAGEVQIVHPRVHIQDVEHSLEGSFVAINQLEVLPDITDGVAIKASAGATDPFGVIPELKLEVPPGRVTVLGILKAFAVKLILVSLAFALLCLVFGRNIMSSAPGAHDAKFPDTGRLFGILSFGVFVLYLRDSHSLFHPILYTEDGAWMAGLYDRGFWDMLINAKGGHSRYFVFLNILILQLAKSTNSLFVGDSLAYLPHLVSFYTTLFYSCLAAAPLYLLSSVMRFEARVLVWALILLVPLGSASFEVLGRASNVGFGVLFLAFCLLVYRRDVSSLNSAKVYGVDAALFLCANTNPLCYPVIFIWYALQAWEVNRIRREVGYYRFGSAERSALVLCVALVVCAIYILLREKGGDSFLGGDLKYSSLVEMIFARSFLFPFVFPVYEHLGDILAITSSIALIAILYWLSSGACSKERWFVVGIAAVFVCSTAATILARPGLSSYLNDYASTHLDRYYFGLSLFVVLLVCAALSIAIGQANKIKKMVVSICIGLIVGIYVGSFSSLFEFDKPVWSDLPLVDFYGSLVRAYSSPDAAEAGAKGVRYRIDLHPKPWITHFPAENVVATLRDRRGLIGPITPSKEQHQADKEVAIAKYEGRVVRQAPNGRGREDGWFLVKDGRRSWISGMHWFEVNGLSSADVIEITSDEFSLIPDSGIALN